MAKKMTNKLARVVLPGRKMVCGELEDSDINGSDDDNWSGIIMADLIAEQSPEFQVAWDAAVAAANTTSTVEEVQ